MNENKRIEELLADKAELIETLRALLNAIKEENWEPQSDAIIDIRNAENLLEEMEKPVDD